MKEDEKNLYLSESNIKKNNKLIRLMVCIILFVVVLILIGVNIKKSISKKEVVATSIKEYFFNNSSMLVENDILKVKGEYFKVDDYEIELKEALVDNDIACGYMMLEIKKSNEEKISQKEVEERFGFTMSITGTMNKKFVYADDKVYVFIDFAADKEYDSKLQMFDYSKVVYKSESGYETHIFNIPSSINSLKFNIDKRTKVILSTLGISIESNKEIENVYLDIYYKDGKKEELYDTRNNKYDNHMDEFGCSSTTNGDSKEDDYYWYYDRFDEILKISDIEHIVYNGEKYTIE